MPPCVCDKRSELTLLPLKLADSANNPIKQQQVGSGSRHPNCRTLVKYRKYKCPKAFGHNSDISENTHCLSQNTNPPRGRGSYIARICFSKTNLESRMTPKIFNIETISTTESSITKSENKGSTVREREISIPLALLGFTCIPHLLHQTNM